MDNVKGRIIIKSDLVVKTGMHIGGGNTSIEIGGIDSSVIKTYKGEPYIPGSSLKGKLRSLSELAYSPVNIAKPCKCGKCFVCKIYGVGANSGNSDLMPTRIIVRDAFLKKEVAEKMKNKEEDFKELEFLYTESKWENTIDRYSSKANPRILERVPEGTIFETEIIYTVYNEEDIDNLSYLFNGLRFLEDDYLGGNGTRGYGKVSFENIKIYVKTLDNYTNTCQYAEYRRLEDIPATFEADLKGKLINNNEQ